ncbi:MAG: ABC transporter permease, partial [Rhodobacteraceae bacterium]|nr:ABC transporter permease [Paracoccaceae bacterium]
AIALFLTFPMWLTVNILGSPDNGVVLSSYLGSWLLAGQFLAIGSALSAMTKNQVIAFVISTAACFLFVMSGVEAVTKAVEGFVPEYILSIFSSMSSLDHFYEFVKGVIDLRSLMFYGSSIIFWLFINIIIINIKKAA